MKPTFISLLQRFNGWRLWTFITVGVIFFVEVLMALIDLGYKGVLTGYSMISALMVSCIVAPLTVYALNLILREFAHIQQRHLEFNVRRAETRLDIAVQNAQMIVWEYDFIKDEFQYDADTLKLLDITLQAPPKTLHEWIALVHPDDSPNFIQHVQTIVQTDASIFDVEYRFMQQVGVWVWVHTRGKIITRTADGKPQLAVGSTMNVDARKQVELKLIRNEQKFNKAFFVNPDAININRLEDGLFVAVNRGFTQMTGYTEQESLGHTSLEFNIWNDPQDRAKLVEGLKKDGEVINLEARFRTKDGHILYGLMSAAIIDIDEVPHIISITRDITERKNAERAVLEAKTRLEIIFNHHPDVMMIVRLDDGCVSQVNHAFTQVTGFTPQEAIGKRTLDLGLWINREMREKLIADVSTFGKSELIEAEFRIKDGTTGIGALSATLVQLDGIPHIISTVRDVTQQKQVAVNLVRSETLLRTTLESTDEGILMVAQDGRILSANQRFLALWRIPAELAQGGKDELMLAHVLDQLVSPDDFLSLVKQLYQSSEEARDTLHFKDGRIFSRFTRSLIIGEERGRIWCFKDITEQARAQAALEQSNQLLNTVINASPVRIFWKDNNLRYLGCNTLFAQDAGLQTPQDLIGKSDFQMGWKEQATLYQADDRQVMESGEAKLLYDEPQATPDGSTIWLRTSKVPLRNVNNSVMGILGVYQDITKQKNIEENLRITKERYDLATQVGQVGTWDWNPITYELAWSDETYRLMGFEPNSVTPSYELYLGLVHADDRENLNNRVQAALNQKQPFAIDCRIVQATGQQIICHVTGNVEFDAQDKPSRMLGTIQDITQRKGIELALAEKEKRLHHALDSSHMGMWDYDFVTHELSWSPDIYHHFKIENPVTSPQHLRNMIHPDDVDIPKQAMHKAISEGTEYFANYRMLCNGREYWTEDRGIIQYDEHGTPLKVLGTAQDITERKQIEASIKLLNANLEQRVKERTSQLQFANQAKDSFLATMSHEIRTPLGGLLGMLELLSLSQLNAQQRELFEVAQDSGKNLLHIVDDILDWSKIEAGKFEIEARAALLADTLTGVERTYAQLASAKGIQLYSHIDPKLSQAHMFDALRVTQVLNNFTSNAIKFTAQGAIEISANLLARQDGYEEISLCVKDSGRGMTTEKQAQLFQLYEQGGAETARMYGGTGLGLSICRKLSDLMGGTITVESHLGCGSTFYFRIRLPIASPQALLELRAQQAQQKTRQHAVPDAHVFTSTDKPLTILVVDDQPVNRLLLKKQLVLLGLQVEKAESGQMALALWKKQHIDLIITDCHMPEMDGYALTRNIRQLEQQDRRARTPIIAWTANVLADEEDQSHTSGMDDILTKPTELADLRAMLLKWLDKAKPAVNPVLDLDNLQKISSKRESQIDLLRDLSQCNAIDIAQLKRALESADNPAASALAHRIKGACRMVGAVELEKVCAAIEQALKQGNLTGASALANTTLNAAVARLDSTIQKFSQAG